jgi:outer membrane lipopolysaccharide assembly protein LptE/RlpB
MTRLFPFAIALALLVSGCGYHVSGRGDTMPKTMHTVAIQSFGNNTLRYKLARLLPADIGRELISRTKYSLIADTSEADAVLSGSLVNYSAFPTVVDPNTNAATTVQVIVIINVTLTERATGKVLFTRQGMEIRQRYEIASQPQQYFDESGTAMERVSKDVARTVVSGILEGF